MYLQKSNSFTSEYLVKKASSSRRGLVVCLGLLLSVLMLLASFFVVNPITASAEEITTTPTQTVVVPESTGTNQVYVDELWDNENLRLDTNNLTILMQYITGDDNFRPSMVQDIARYSADMETLNSQSLDKGSYDGVKYAAKTSDQDIVVEVAGIKWTPYNLFINTQGEMIFDLEIVDRTELGSLTLSKYLDDYIELCCYFDVNDQLGYQDYIHFNLNYTFDQVYNLANAVKVQENDATERGVLELNGIRLVEGLHYSTGSSEDGDGIRNDVLLGEGAYSDYQGVLTSEIESKDSLVAPTAVALPTTVTMLDTNYSATALLSGTTYNGTSGRTLTITVKKKSNSTTQKSTLNVSTSGSTAIYWSDTANGLNAGVGSVKYTISARALSDATVSTSGSGGTYNGSSYSISLSSVKFGSYTCSSSYYSKSGTWSATSPGTYYAQLTGSSYTTGTVTVKTWYIYKRSIADATLSCTDPQYYLANIQITPTVTVKYGGSTVSSSNYTVSYGTNKEIWTGYIYVTGKGSYYEGSKTLSFSIYRRTITTSYFTRAMSTSSFTFTGSAIQPSSYFYMYPSGYGYGSSYTVPSSNFSFSYSNNTYPGTATMTITGINNMADSTTMNFTITARTMSSYCTMGSVSNYYYTGSAIKPTPTITDSSLGTRTAGTHFNYSYSNNTSPGTATVTATGISSYGYTGSISKNFTIYPSSLSSISLSTTSYTYDTGTKAPSATVYCNGSAISSSYYTLSGTTSAVNAGTYTITATGKSPYTGSVSATYIIIPNTGWTVTLSSSSFTYTGSAQTSTVTVKIGSTAISSSYYSCSWANNTNAGTATVTVTGKTNLSGTKYVYPTIAKRNLSAATMASVSAQTYTGAAICPTPSVTYNSMTLNTSSHFSYSYSSNTSVGTATVTATAYSSATNYTGSKSVTFTISQRAVSGCTITMSASSYTYTGSAQYPSISSVKYGSNNVTTASISAYKNSAGTSISASSSVNAGSYSVTISGSGNLSGTTTWGYTISARPMSAVTIASVANQTYTGTAIKPTPTATYNGMTLSSSSDFTYGYSANTNVGTATITLTGKGNYTGSKSITFAIVQRGIASCTSTLGTTSYTYTGGAHTPTVTVKYGGTTLYDTNNTTNCTVTYSNNINKGTATVTLTGKNNLSGTKSLTFTITARAISEVTYPTFSNETYTTSAITKTITLTYNSMTLVNGEDYSYTYSNNTNVGTATISFTGKGNYGGTAAKTFSITQRAISAATFDTIANQTYTTYEIKPTPILRYNNNNPLVSGTDYTSITYTNNINVGTATVTVTGKGNYTGTHSKTFAIVARAIGETTAESIANQTYTTADIKPIPVFNYGNDKPLVSGTDYNSITYANNKNVGTASITIKGIGNYTGSKTITFNIVQRDISEVTVDSITNQTYTGVAITPVPTMYYSNDNKMVSDRDYSPSFTYANNTNVGTASVTITGKGNYKGTKTVNFTIVQKDIKDCSVALSSYEFTYNTSAQSVSVTVKIGSTTIASTNYTVSGNSGITANTYTVTLTGKNNLKGTNNSQTFVINPKTLETSMVANIPHQRYIHDGNGNPTAVELDESELKLSYNNDNPMSRVSDYSFTLTNATSIYEDTTFTDSSKSKPYVTITGKGNYVGTITKYFIIYDNNLDLDPEASLFIFYEDSANDKGNSGKSHVYTGHNIEPATIVKWSTNTLTKNTDYKVAYSNNLNVGTATVTITGIGAYNGTVNINFSITQADISLFDYSNVTVSPTKYTYDGIEKKPTPTLVYEHSDLCTPVCSTQKAITCSTMCVSNCTAKASVTLSSASNKDYSYAYTNNINAGRGLVTFTGKGNYTGIAYASFEIEKLAISVAEVNGIATAGYEYTGKAITPDITVVYNNGSTTVTLVNNKDYYLTYKNNVNVGQATITLNGMGNFQGTDDCSFTIVSVPVSATDDRLDFANIPSQTYTGSAIEPDVHVSFNTKPLVEGTDYDVDYTNNVNAGTATAIVTGKPNSNFTGSITKEFTINKKDISDLTVTFKGDINEQSGHTTEKDGRYAFTGSQISPTIEMEYNGKKLIAGTDFNISYVTTDRIKVGAKSIEIKGAGSNFTGTIATTFQVFSYELKEDSVSLDTSNTNYRGVGVAVKPKVTVADPDATFDVVYANNTTAGEASVTVTGNGKYSGTLNFTYNVNPVDISASSVSVESHDIYFTDNEYRPNIEIKFAATDENGELKETPDTLVEGTDFVVENIEIDNVNFVGRATISAKANGNFVGARSVEFNIVARDIADPSVTVNTLLPVTYNGTAHTPSVTLAYAAATLVEGTDYTITYNNNINAGVATVVINGIGNYGGTRTLTFQIMKKTLNVHPTFVAEEEYFEYASLPQLSDVSVEGLGTFEWVDPNFSAGTFDYEWNFVPYDTDNYEIVSGKFEFTATDISIERIETEIVDNSKYQAYNTFDKSGVIVKVVYSNGNSQVLEDDQYELSIKDDEYLVVGEQVFVKVEEGGNEHVENMGIVVTARPLTVTFDGFANLTESEDNQTIGVTVEGNEGYDNVYSVVYHNLSTGTTSDAITVAGNYKVEVLLNDNNFTFTGANTVSFNVKAKALSNENVSITAEAGFDGGSSITLNTYETEAELVEAYNLDNIDFGGKYLRAYSFDIYSDGVTLTNNTETTAPQNIQVTLKANDISTNNLKLYAVRNGNLIALDYTVADGEFVFNCQLTDVVVFVEEDVKEPFNWAILIWTLVGLVVVGAVIGTVLYFDVKKKKGKK